MLRAAQQWLRDVPLSTLDVAWIGVISVRKRLRWIPAESQTICEPIRINRSEADGRKDFARIVAFRIDPDRHKEDNGADKKEANSYDEPNLAILQPASPVGEAVASSPSI